MFLIGEEQILAEPVADRDPDLTIAIEAPGGRSSRRPRSFHLPGALPSRPGSRPARPDGRRGGDPRGAAAGRWSRSGPIPHVITAHAADLPFGRERPGSAGRPHPPAGGRRRRSASSRRRRPPAVAAPPAAGVERSPVTQSEPEREPTPQWRQSARPRGRPTPDPASRGGAARRPPHRRLRARRRPPPAAARQASRASGSRDERPQRPARRGASARRPSLAAPRPLAEAPGEPGAARTGSPRRPDAPHASGFSGDGGTRERPPPTRRARTSPSTSPAPT